VKGLARDSDVLRERGTEGDEFDSAFQGSEWDQFLALMTARGIPIP